MLELLAMCAPAVDPVTMSAIVKQESGGKPWAINNNTTKKSTVYESKAAAVAAVLAAVKRGESVDMGLAQINSKNLQGLGLSVEQVFDPCVNIAAGAKILGDGYKKTGTLPGALSMYNTGKADSSIGSAYAKKVFSQSGVMVPAIPGGQVAKLPAFNGAVVAGGQGAAMPMMAGEGVQAAALQPVRLAVTPSPFVAGLSPVNVAWGSAVWR